MSRNPAAQTSSLNLTRGVLQGPVIGPIHFSLLDSEICFGKMKRGDLILPAGLWKITSLSLNESKFE